MPDDPDQFGRKDLDRNLDKTVIALPLIEAMRVSETTLLDVIIDSNLDYRRGRLAARKRIMKMIETIVAKGRRRRRACPQERAEPAVRLRAAAAGDHPQAGAAGRRRDVADVARDLQDLARPRDRRIHQQVDQHRQGRRGAQHLRRARPRHRLGGDRFGDRRRPSALQDPRDARASRSRSTIATSQRLGGGGSDDAHDAAALRDETGHGTHVAGIIAGEIAVPARRSAIRATDQPPPRRQGREAGGGRRHRPHQRHGAARRSS